MCHLDSSRYVSGVLLFSLVDNFSLSLGVGLHNTSGSDVRIVHFCLELRLSALLTNMRLNTQLKFVCKEELRRRARQTRFAPDIDNDCVLVVPDLVMKTLDHFAFCTEVCAKRV